jgi:hypothetical protein
MVMSPAGLGPENDCAGEDQQQLRQADRDYNPKCSVGKNTGRGSQWSWLGRTDWR